MLLLKFTTVVADKWKLAFNIHGSDGHNFGYGASAWDDESDVGTHETAFTADYKNYDVTNETANFIAIARHQNGACEAVGVWEFLEVGKTLHNYLDADLTSRLRATKDNCTYSYISNTMEQKEKDPIFAVDGGLVFNWWYGSNNGVRIGNSETWYKEGLPAVDDEHYRDDYHGLGNEFGADTPNGKGGVSYWFDVGVYQGQCSGGGCSIQGTDHGTSMNSGTLYGQYAIFISDTAKAFPCEDVDLEISMFELKIDDYDRIDRGHQGFLTYDEVVFDLADVNKDGFLSLQEYSEARIENRYGETITTSDVRTDFHRIDKDGDGLLNFDDISFDMADTNNDDKLSIVEYSRARADLSLGEGDQL